MPEGDTVWLTARRLHEALAGRVLTRSDMRVPRYATTNLAGRTVTEVAARGKHLLIRVEGGITVHTHLRMDGSWRVTASPRAHRPAATASGSCSPTTPGRRSATSWASSRSCPPPGRPAWSATWGRTCSAPTGTGRRRPGGCGAAPARAIGEALLDQRNLAGIGNLYKAEVLFLRGVDPWRPVGEVTGLDALVSTAQRLMDANKERFSQVTTGCGGRASRPGCTGGPGGPAAAAAPRSGPPSQGGDTTERITFWCPHCQS